LFKITTQGISCDISMYISIITQIDFFCFSFYLSPLHRVVLAGLKILYSFCVESTSTIFTFLTSFFYLPPLICDLPLAWPVFHNIAVFILGLYIRKHAAFDLRNLANFI
jgi:hypothetical protein